MTVTPASLRQGFPEFTGTPDSLVQAKINDAGAFVDAGVWGDKYDTGIAYMAAHLLACSPAGQNARMIDPKTAKTTYKTVFANLVPIAVAGGNRVI